MSPLQGSGCVGRMNSQGVALGYCISPFQGSRERHRFYRLFSNDPVG